MVPPPDGASGYVAYRATRVWRSACATRSPRASRSGRRCSPRSPTGPARRAAPLPVLGHAGGGRRRRAARLAGAAGGGGGGGRPAGAGVPRQGLAGRAFGAQQGGKRGHHLPDRRRSPSCRAASRCRFAPSPSSGWATRVCPRWASPSAASTRRWTPTCGSASRSTPTATVHGVTSWMPVYAPGGGGPVGWTLDVMRRLPDGFRYTMEFLIASACLAFKDGGRARWCSLSGVPLGPGRARTTPPSTAAGLDAFLDTLGATARAVLRVPVAAGVQVQVPAAVRPAVPRLPGRGGTAPDRGRAQPRVPARGRRARLHLHGPALGRVFVTSSMPHTRLRGVAGTTLRVVMARGGSSGLLARQSTRQVDPSAALHRRLPGAPGWQASDPVVEDGAPSRGGNRAGHEPDRRRAARRGPLRDQAVVAGLEALLLVLPALRPGKHPPRPAAGQQRRHRRRRAPGSRRTRTRTWRSSPGCYAAPWCTRTPPATPA